MTHQPTTPAENDTSTSTRVAYFIQCQQPDGTWETASSGMDALTQDYAIKHLERRRQMMPDFPFRLVRRTTTTTIKEEPLDA